MSYWWKAAKEESFTQALWSKREIGARTKATEALTDDAPRFVAYKLFSYMLCISYYGIGPKMLKVVCLLLGSFDLAMGLMIYNRAPASPSLI